MDDTGTITYDEDYSDAHKANLSFEERLFEIRKGLSGRDVEVSLTMVTRHYHARPELTKDPNKRRTKDEEARRV